MRTICIVLVIALLSVLTGLLAENIKHKLDRASHPKEYSELVEKYADIYKVPEPICYAVIKCESGFDSAAKSRSGAIGLMQLMPDTFAYLCDKAGEDYESGMLYDPETNIRFGIFYLSMLYERFGVWETVFAAYNCGPTRVSFWIESGKADSGGKLLEIPISETAVYVERVTNAIRKYETLYYQG